MNAGKSIQLTPILQGAQIPDKAKYQWTTTDKGVATVSKGKVSGKKAGTVLEPVTRTTTGLTLSTPRVGVIRSGSTVYTEEVVEIDMYPPDKE